MNPTPQEVISLYKEYEKLHQDAATMLQKHEVIARRNRALHCVEWEVEFSDVDNSDYGEFTLTGKVNVPQLLRWWRAVPFRAYLESKDDLREHLLTLRPGQRVRLVGTLYYSGDAQGHSFFMRPARLLS